VFLQKRDIDLVTPYNHDLHPSEERVTVLPGQFCRQQRCVDRRLFQTWEELVNIAESLVLSGDEDESVWQFSSAGSTHQSLYGVINFKWVVPVYVPAVWKTIVPL
jgi:hypothetical protein